MRDFNSVLQRAFIVFILLTGSSIHYGKQIFLILESVSDPGLTNSDFKYRVLFIIRNSGSIEGMNEEYLILYRGLGLEGPRCHAYCISHFYFIYRLQIIKHYKITLEYNYINSNLKLLLI
jgi:hypothetical protein